VREKQVARRDFTVAHNTTITPEASAKKAQKGHPTDIIEDTFRRNCDRQQDSVSQ